MKVCLLYLGLAALTGSASVAMGATDFLDDGNFAYFSDGGDEFADLDLERQNGVNNIIRLDIENGTAEAIMSTNHPENFPASFKELWRFDVAEGTQLCVNCTVFHVPRRPNALWFSVRDAETGDLLRSFSRFQSGSEPEMRNFCAMQAVSVPTVIRMLLVTDRTAPFRLGTGLNCMAFGMGEEEDPEPMCGQASSPMARIIDGTDTSVAEHPWHAGIFIGDGATIECGGTIIAPNKVLTAAACVDDENGDPADPATITVGVACDSSSLDDCTPIGVTDVAIADGWDPDVINNGNDVAILTLDTELTFDLDENINAACLPESSSDCLDVGSSVTGIGFGAGVGEDPLPQLAAGDMTVASDNACMALNSNILCTIETGSGRTCVDDGGGFLGLAADGQYTVHGVTSYGFADCPEGGAMGFSEVCMHMDFINEQLDA